MITLACDTDSNGGGADGHSALTPWLYKRASSQIADELLLAQTLAFRASPLRQQAVEDKSMAGAQQTRILHTPPIITKPLAIGSELASSLRDLLLVRKCQHSCATRLAVLLMAWEQMWFKSISHYFVPR
eukprot:scaffold141526_cov18-Prasinocladus_malaysianus.AAC.2